MSSCGGEFLLETRAVARLRCVAVLFAVLLAGMVRGGEDKPPPTPGQAIQMNFKDTPLDTVLEQLSEMSGLIVVKDTPLEGRVTIISKQPMNVEEAVGLLNSVLKEKGYVGIRTARILKIVKLDEAKKRNIPVRTGNDPEKIEASDEVFTQVIPIKYIDSAALKRDFAPLIPSYADLSANAGSNTLILTDTGANIKRIVEIIRAMDTQSTTVAEVKVFQLKFANATSAARLINDTFKDDQQSGGNNQQNLPPWMRGNQRFGGGGGGGGGGPPMREGAAGEGADAQGARLRKVSASADDRTNAVVVSASPDTMLIIAQVIKDLDSNPAEEQSVFTYRCKNAQSDNLEAVLNAVFGASGSSTINRSATQRRTSSSTGIGQDVSRGASSSRLPGSSVTSTPAPQTNTRGNNTGGFGQNPFAGGNNANNRGTGTNDLTGQVYVVADIDSNSLIVLTAPKNFERVKSIIMELDKPVPQVLIKVLIAEVTHDKNNDIGVDVSILTQGTVKSAVTDFGTAAATGGLITKLVDKDIAVTLRAIEGVSKLDILSRPYILASDNQLSTITVGQEVPFIISSRTTDTGQTINTIQYQDIGIILNVTPHINEDGLVIMDVAPEVSSLTGTTVPISENASAPVFAKRSAQSRVGIQDGQTIVIGGLMEDKKTENIQGVPVLGRLPGIGTLFRRRITDKSKTELLIFLTPHVALDPHVLKHMTEEEKAGLKLTPKAVAPGAFQDHLDGLNRGGAEIIPDDRIPVRPAPKTEAPESLKSDLKPDAQKTDTQKKE